jgi:hypothetical protein
VDSGLCLDMVVKMGEEGGSKERAGISDQGAPPVQSF